MTKEKYYRLHLKNVSSDSQELIALWCFENGAGGISEALSFRQNPQDYSVETVSTATSDLEVFFSVPLAPEAPAANARKARESPVVSQERRVVLQRECRQNGV